MTLPVAELAVERSVVSAYSLAWSVDTSEPVAECMQLSQAAEPVELAELAADCFAVGGTLALGEIPAFLKSDRQP